jgi:hypothetical protein
VKRVIVALATGAVILCACTTDATKAREALIGKSKGEVLACMGIPRETAVSGGTEILSYSTRPKADLSISVQPPTAANSLNFYCVANVALTEGHVSSVRYQGNTGGQLTGGDPVCSELMSGCER